MKKFIFLTLILSLLLIPTLVAAEIIRPTDLCDSSGFFDVGSGNAWDDSLTTYTYNSGNMNNFDIHFGEDNTCTQVDAWDTPAFSGTFESAIIYAKYSKTACVNDSATVYFANSADVHEQEMYTDVVIAIALTTSSWDITSTYLGDLTDLRFGLEISKSGSRDACEFRTYEVWIEAIAGGRQRIILMQ